MIKRLFIFGTIFLFFLVSCKKEEQKDRYTFYAMDTVIAVTFYNENYSKEYEEQVETIFKKYDKISNDFVSGLDTISVYDLNQKREAEVNDELLELLNFSMEMQEDTNGYFNPFIGRLSHLWKQSFELEEKKLLDKDIVSKELTIMQQTTLEITGNKVKLIGEGNIDLGGIAKGFAAHKVKEYLDSVNCHRYLLNAGTSTLILGNKNEEPFVVGLSKALGAGNYYTLKIKEKAIATSSIREQHVEIEKEYYSHILNPKTGYPAKNYDTISIIGQDSKTLDAYSTACFSMELEELKAFMKEKGLEFIVSKDNQLLYKSSGVDEYA